MSDADAEKSLPFQPRTYLAHTLFDLYRQAPEAGRLETFDAILEPYGLLPETRDKILKLCEAVLLAQAKARSELAQLLLRAPIPDLEAEADQLKMRWG